MEISGFFSYLVINFLVMLTVVSMVLQHLLFSVTEPQYRVKPAAVSDVSIFLIFSTISWKCAAFLCIMNLFN